MTFNKLKITIAGAGITGLWQALMLAHRGHEVQLIEQSQTPFSNAMSQYAGAMLAPYCEREGAGCAGSRFGNPRSQVSSATERSF